MPERPVPFPKVRTQRARRPWLCAVTRGGMIAAAMASSFYGNGIFALWDRPWYVDSLRICDEQVNPRSFVMFGWSGLAQHVTLRFHSPNLLTTATRRTDDSVTLSNGGDLESGAFPFRLLATIPTFLVCSVP